MDFRASNTQSAVNRFALTAFFILTSSPVMAGTLDLADNALEIVTGVEPNIMVLADDSSSMDWGVMTDQRKGVFFLDGIEIDGLEYYYTHPAPGASGATSPAVNTYEDYYSYIVPSEQKLVAAGVAAPQGGVWRAWNSDYNRIYYNPNTTYQPWAGVDANGNAYGNASTTNAPYNPYDSALGGLDLTSVTSYETDCTLDACAAVGVVGVTGIFTVTDFYPARYFTWSDSNNDGVVDADDGHTLVEIRSSGCSTGASCPSNFVRSVYDENTGSGRRDCGTDNGDGTVTCSYNEEIQNFANWFTYYRKREVTAKAALSKVIENNTSARIGYATIHNNARNRIQVAPMNASPASGSKKTLLDKIFLTSSRDDTPLRSNLDAIGRYFECASGDIFDSSADTSPGDAGCPVLASPAGTCQQNYALLITDGFYNGSVPDPFVSNSDGQNSGAGNSDFDGGAFADSYSDTLADVAMHYYERDLHTLDDEVPTTSKDRNRYAGSGTLDADDRLHQHMSTYTVGFGVEGTLTAMPSDPTTAYSWPDPTAGDPQKIDDLRHAAYNGRGDFISANNPEALTDALEEIFEEIGTGEGAASSVAFNTQTIESDSLVFRAFFNTKDNTGDLVAQHINPDGSLNVDADLNPIFEWSVAEQLDNKTGTTTDSRVIITYNDNGANSAGVGFRWTGSSTIASDQKTLLDSPQPGNITLPATVGEARLGYLRGHSDDEGPSFDDGEFRERLGLAGRLGDIVHSSPVFVGKPPYTGRISAPFPGEFPNNVDDLYTTFKTNQANRTAVVYVGANDGMLHAVTAHDGEELFAYVPNLIFNNLSKLTKPDYNHRFYVDLSPSINDIFMVKPGALSATWNTVLIGGLGAGGKGYYALNITDPSSFNTETNAVDNVMWEFTEADDGGVGASDLGYSFSQPLIAMSNAEDGNHDKKWIAVFGNGYNSTSTDGDAALYILFIEAGQDGVWDNTNGDFVKISTGNGKDESSDGTTPNGIGGVRGIDIDANGTVDRIYAGDLQGNLYRFDISDTNPGNWDNSNNVDIIFKARYGASFPRTIVQPITTRPIIVDHPDEPGYIVIVATGSWMTNDDATSTDIQSLYGIWDNDSGTEVMMDSTTNQLVEQEFINHNSKEHGYTVRTSTNRPVDWNDTSSVSNQVLGWYIDLDMPPATGAGIEYPGERAVRNLQLRGGFLFVNTVIPKSTNACSTGAGGFELGFDPVTGGSGVDVIFDVSGDGAFDLEDMVNDTAGASNVITGTRFDDSTPTDSAFIGNQRITQTSDKKVRSMATNTIVDDLTGRHSWREIVQQ
jgi:type IV pilus assembly protein PilY1